MHRIISRFWKCFDNFAHPIKVIAEENFKLLKENPRHSLLHFKRVDNYGLQKSDYMALAVEDGSDFIEV